MFEQLTKPPIAPIYSQSEPNQPIELGRVPIQYGHNGSTYDWTAKVTLRFSPKDRLEFVCPENDADPFFGPRMFTTGASNGQIVLKDRGVTIDAMLTGSGGDRGGIVFSPTRSGITSTLPSEYITTATFHVFNFPEFRGPDDYILITGSPPQQGMKGCGRAILKAGGWRIVIAATDRTDGLAKQLKTQGGYVITHVGEITREDGSTFSSDQLADLLCCLHYFLSFAMGRWAGVALPVGFDVQGNRVFEEWGMRMTADGAWNGSSSWFDAHHGGLLSQVFPGFFSLWMNNLWRQPLTHALYWYLGACDRRVGVGVDTGLILAQTALETLAWTYCVLDRKIALPKDFKRGGLSAAEKLLKLISSLAIPKSIPSSFSALQSIPGKQWADGPHAITGIRNSLVHPDTVVQIPGKAYYEAWLLSLWYIDLILLHLCGHQGRYANRLNHRWVGQVESVPWANPSP